MKLIITLAVSLTLGTGCGISATLPGWNTNLALGLVRAAEQKQPVLVYYTASWCGPCKLMAKTTFADETVVQALQAVTRVAVDIDEQPKLAEANSINGVPTFQMLTPNGDEVARTSGYQDAPQFIQWLTNGVVQTGHVIEQQKWLEEKLASAEALLAKPDDESLRKAAAELFDIYADSGGGARAKASALLVALGERHAILLLDGLNHPRLAARIYAANLLRTKVGESFDVDPWADSATRLAGVAQWREKLSVATLRKNP